MKVIGQYQTSDTIEYWNQQIIHVQIALFTLQLHSLPKFASKTHRIQVGNGQYVSVLSIIPIIVCTVIDLRYIP